MKKVKIFVVTKLARQVEGEYVFIQVEKASNRKSDIEDHLKLPFSPTEIMQTPAGEVPCVCERGVLELDLDLHEEG